MEISHTALSNIEETDNIEVNMEKYANLSKIVMNRTKEIELPETCIGISEDYKELKNITFTKDKIEFDDALEGMVKALDIMAIVDLKKLPAENLENIIRLLIAVCNDCNRKIRNSNEIIAQMDFGMFELFTTNEKLEAIEKYRKKLETEIKESRDKYDHLRDEYIDIQEQLKTLVEN